MFDSFHINMFASLFTDNLMKAGHRKVGKLSCPNV